MAERRNRRGWVRHALMYLVFAVFAGAAVWAIGSRRHELLDALHRLSWQAVVGSLIAGYLAIGAMLLSWDAAIRDAGVHIGVRDAGRIYCVGQVGKYLPGSVWPVLVQSQLARRRGVSPLRMASGSLFGLAVSVCASLVFGCLLLPFSGHDVARKLWWAPVIAVPMILCLHPRLLNWLVGLAARVLRRGEVTSTFSWRGVLESSGWTFVGSVLFGLHVFLLGHPLGLTGVHGFLLATAAYALASSIGVIIVFAPAGAGAREAVLTAVLAPMLDVDSALLIALVSRAVLVIVDVTLAGIQLPGLRHLGVTTTEAMADTDDLQTEEQI